MAGPCGPSAVREKLMELDGGSTEQRRARRLAEIGLPPCFPTRRLCSDWPASTYAGCGGDKLHWQRTECSDWLAMEGLLWPQQVMSLSDVDIQTKADLGAMFLDEAEAAEADLSDAWHAVRGEVVPSAGHRIRSTIAEVGRQLGLEAKRQKTTPTQQAPSKRMKACQPQNKRDLNPSADEGRRRVAATAAADLCESWGSLAGPCRNIADEGVRKRRLDRLINRIVYRQTEAACIYAALPAWKVWVEFCSMNEVDPHDPFDVDVEDFCWESAVNGKTAPRARWDHLRWVARHLQGLPEMPQHTRPPKSVSKGEVSRSNQAVEIEPEMLIRIEHFLPVLRERCD